MGNSDTRGYYSILGLQPDATSDSIKLAYRRLAKELHPDQNVLGPSATTNFQILAEAYETLGDPKKRAKYDLGSYTEIHLDTAGQPCVECGAITPQLRYVSIPYVLGISPSNPTRRFEGVYCAGCALAKVAKAFAITMIAGWWRIPGGPICSIKALRTILTDDCYPDRENADLIIRQANYYFANGEAEVASHLVWQADKLKKTGIAQQRLAELRRFIPAPGRSVSQDQWLLPQEWSSWTKLAPFIIASLLVLGTVTYFYGRDHPSPSIKLQSSSNVLIIDARGTDGK